jgi:hypothetical protein
MSEKTDTEKPEATPKRGEQPGPARQGMFWNGRCWQRIEIERQEIETVRR